MKKSLFILAISIIIGISSCSLFGGGEIEISGEWLTNTDAGLYHYTFADTLGFWDIPYTEMGGGMEILSFDNGSRTLIAYFSNHHMDELKGKYAKISWTEPENDTTVLTTYTPADSAALAEAVEVVFIEATCGKDIIANVGTKSNPANMSILHEFGLVQMHGVIPKDKLLYITGLTEYALNAHTIDLTFQSEDLDIYSYTPDFDSPQESSINGGTATESITGTTDTNKYIYFMIDASNITSDWATFSVTAGT